MSYYEQGRAEKARGKYIFGPAKRAPKKLEKNKTSVVSASRRSLFALNVLQEAWRWLGVDG